MINVSGVGRLVADIELRYTASNLPMATGTLVVNEWDGKKREEVAKYFDIVVFGDQAERIVKIGNKGTLLAISGKLSYNEVEKDGNKTRYINLILDRFDLVNSGKKNNSSQQIVSASASESASSPIDEGDIPF